MFKNAPLKSLRFFEAAARNLSFKKAGDELNVTAAAVGQQIKTLEEFLGVKLFIRHTRAITLSEDGQKIFPGIREALQKIETTLGSIQPQQNPRFLSVTTVHSFAAKWLFPRLGRFSLKHPEIDVQLMATRQILDFRQDSVDVAIRIAQHDPKTDQLHSVRLFGESYVPVCAPSLVEKGPELNCPEDLNNHTLIHDDTMAIYGNYDWADWFKTFGVEGVEASRGPRFNPSTMPIQAALNGLGVALARKSLIRDDLKDGLLVMPFEMEMQSDVAYYLLYPKDSPQLEKIHAFQDWILDEAANL